MKLTWPDARGSKHLVEDFAKCAHSVLLLNICARWRPANDARDYSGVWAYPCPGSPAPSAPPDPTTILCR
jgi:hypothetical protein